MSVNVWFHIEFKLFLTYVDISITPLFIDNFTIIQLKILLLNRAEKSIPQEKLQIAVKHWHLLSFPQLYDVEKLLIIFCG